MVANNIQATRARHRHRVRILLLLLAILAFGLTAYVVYARTRVPALVADAVGRSILPSVFVTPVPRKDSSGNVQTFPDWDKNERVNILLLGLDTRNEEIPLSDTIIVVSVDPLSKTAGMLSIPRDLWVNIPGFGEHKINASYSLGMQNDPASGGPALVEQTVEEDFGIPIHYFAQVDFAGFEQIVDTVGGVTIDVKRPIKDDEYPTPDFGYTRIFIPAGPQHMDGKTALQYARSRHSEDDLGRNARQQQVIMSIKEQAVNLNLLPKLGDLLGEIQGMVKTDLSFTQVGSLAKLAQSFSSDDVYSRTIDWTMVGSYRTPGGEDVLLPNWAVIKPLVSGILNDTKLAKDNATILVENGTTTEGLAAQVAQSLREKGFNVIDVQQSPDAGQHPYSEILTYSEGQTYTIDKLAKSLSIDPARVSKGTDQRQGVDIVVILGNEAVLPTGN